MYFDDSTFKTQNVIEIFISNFICMWYLFMNIRIKIKIYDY